MVYGEKSLGLNEDRKLNNNDNSASASNNRPVDAGGEKNQNNEKQLNNDFSAFQLLPTSANRSVFRCPEKFGYFADSKDCTKYFVCVFGEALHEVCTGGLYFSSELQTCEYFLLS